MYNCIEVCAGAGGQAIGLHRAGFRHSALVEIDINAAESLRQNGRRTRWWRPTAVHQTSLVGWVPPPDIGFVDLLSGGVPCPPFSIAGRQLGHEDERDLFPAILDLAATVQPTVIMIENVRGLLGSKFDAYRESLLGRLAELGYHGEWELLEAHEFGVPQLRPRSILVAAKPEVWKYFKWPTPSIRTVTVGEALSSLMASGGWEGADAWAQHANTIAPTLVGGSKKHGGADLGPTRARQCWADRLGVNGVSLADAPPVPGLVGMPRLTIAMAAAVQGFPANWIFSGRKTAAYRQVGNAFPPPVAEAVGHQISAALRASEAATTK